MDKYLLKAKDTYRIPTVEEVEQFHEELLKDPNFTVIAFAYKTKQIKKQGEVVEEYQVVDVTKEFTNEKDPEDHYDVWYGLAGTYDKKAEDF